MRTPTNIIIVILLLLSYVIQPVPVSAETVYASRSLGVGSLVTPVDVAVGGYGIYVSDTGRESVIALGEDGSILREVKMVENKPITPAGICITEDSILYVCDLGNHRVISMTPNLDVIEVFEQEDIGVASPIDITVDEGNKIYVLSMTDRKIAVINPVKGKGNNHLIASPGVEKDHLACPRGIDVFGEQFAVADLGVGKSRIFNKTNGEVDQYGIPGTYPNSLSGAYDNAWDSLGNLYVVDRNNNDVVIFPATGLEAFSWGRYGRVGSTVDFFYSSIEPVDFNSSPGRLCRPQGIDISGDCMYIADTGNGRIVSVSLDEVWRIPRVPIHFMQQNSEIPAMIASPMALDFGVVSNSLTKTVSVQFTSFPELVGYAYILGDSGITVEPSVFIGSNIDFNVTLNAGGAKGIVSATLVLKSGNRSVNVPIVAKRGNTRGLVFTCRSDRLVTMTRNGGFALLEVMGQNGFTGDVKLETTLPVYRPAWAKVAKNIDELSITTVGMSFSNAKINIGSGEHESLLSVYESGRLKSGLYTFKVIAYSVDNPDIKATHTITLSIQSRTTDTECGTVLYEAFTAHWCNPCGFHREAQYRLMEEYGRRNILPVAYHVMDEDDETGMTTDLNFSRFKKYEGTGVPLSVMNGNTLTISGNDSTHRYAADRIRGRKYSGTSFEYWKLRAEYSLTSRDDPVYMQLSGYLEGYGGGLSLRVRKSDRYSGRLGNIFILLVEDGIEYFSENGEMYHSCVVRDFLTPVSSDKHFIQTDFDDNFFVTFNFSLPVLPEDFEINTENLSLVAFVEDAESNKIIGSHWYDLSAPTVCKAEIFASGDITLEKGSLSKIAINVSGTGTCTDIFAVDVKCSHDFMNADMPVSTITVMPGETQTVNLYLSTKSPIPPLDVAFIDIIATDREGNEITQRCELLTR